MIPVFSALFFSSEKCMYWYFKWVNFHRKQYDLK